MSLANFSTSEIIEELKRRTECAEKKGVRTILLGTFVLAPRWWVDPSLSRTPRLRQGYSVPPHQGGVLRLPPLYW